VSLEVDVTFSQGLPLGSVVILESGKQVASAPFSSTGTPAGDTLLVNVGTFGAVATRVHYDDVVVIAN